MILAKKSEEVCSNIYTNTKSFASKYQKTKPKFNVRKAEKDPSVLP